ncbi:MAG: hypothetical protein UW86_C0004G0036 [Microgenomates group bacterium GW2011_GWA1_Microgenomates_45_10]|nr:MAG: hypothetical protein UW86_C0004G0036 [Microgenomates group bacterium GW2011_GWA1_Microgenomates_45_10]
MKKNRLDNFIKRATNVSLSAGERDNIKRVLITHVEMDVRGARDTRLIRQRSQKINLSKVMPILLALVLTFSGGTALAANGTLPGDFLYPVKINFNEKVRGALAFSDEAEAEFQAELATRRLEELQRLTVSGDEDTEASIKTRDDTIARFEVNAENAIKLAESLRLAGKADAAVVASSRLKASLEANEDLFEHLSERREDLRARLQAIAERVKIHADAVAEVRADAVARVAENENANIEVIAKTRAKQAEQNLEAAKRRLDRYESDLDSSIKAKAEQKIEAAQEAYSSGEGALEAENYVDALQYFQASLSYSEQADIMVRVWVSLEIDLASDEEEDDLPSDEDRADQDQDDNTPDSDEEVNNGNNGSGNDERGDEDRDSSVNLDADANAHAGVNTGNGRIDLNIDGNAGANIGL